MNLLLFDPGEWENPLPLSDPRSLHIINILKTSPGERLAAGVVGGLKGTILLQGKDQNGLKFADPCFTEVPPPPLKLTFLIGTPRPPTAQRLLRDLTTLGAQRLVFTATRLGEKSYLTSKLWHEDWKKALLEGAMQAKATYLPQIERYMSLKQALENLGAESGLKFAFDGSGSSPLATYPDQPTFLALGPERGWTDQERQLFLDSGWQILTMGNRVLRTETACTAAAIGILTRQGLW
ncbi:MAG: 16S rRNA (uracil(1498)-N(3))-methyltransferase [Spirochaetales bacterium]|nr:16S rRNA (uracil(1498)-N(3))-methyltransferase [Spirochaetales bacterium]